MSKFIEVHIAENVRTSDKPMIIAAQAIIGPNDELEHGIGIPVRRLEGTYEELRAAMHRDVDRLFEAHLKLGEFTE